MNKLNKVLKKISNNVICTMMLYLFVIIMGSVIMSFPAFGLIEPVLYISILFFGFSAVSFIFYFLGRKKDDYELLFLSLTGVMIATFLLATTIKSNEFALGTGLLIFAIGMLFTKIYKIVKLKKINELFWIEKLMTTSLITLLSVLTITNLYNGETIQTMMFGYYFITFGILSLIDPIFEICYIFSENKKEEKSREKAIQKKTTSKPTTTSIKKKVVKKPVTEKKTISKPVTTSVKKKTVKKDVTEKKATSKPTTTNTKKKALTAKKTK